MAWLSTTKPRLKNKIQKAIAFYLCLQSCINGFLHFGILFSVSIAHYYTLHKTCTMENHSDYPHQHQIFQLAK